MDFASFHKSLVGSDPTPVQLILYKHLKTCRGFLGGVQDPEVFEAIFIAALALTVDPSTKDYRRVYLFYPKELEKSVTDAINDFLQYLRKVPISEEQRGPRNRGLVKAMNHVMRGTNIPQVSRAPEHWLAYGYTTDNRAPQWIHDKLDLY